MASASSSDGLLWPSPGISCSSIPVMQMLLGCDRGQAPDRAPAGALETDMCSLAAVITRFRQYAQRHALHCLTVFPALCAPASVVEVDCRRVAAADDDADAFAGLRVVRTGEQRRERRGAARLRDPAYRPPQCLLRLHDRFVGDH